VVTPFQAASIHHRIGSLKTENKTRQRRTLPGRALSE